MEKSIFDVNQMIGKLSEICLKEETLKSFVPKISFLKEKYQKAEVVTTIVGDFNSGKTSLCNFLLGKNALPTGSTPCTSTVYELRFSCEEEKASILNKLGEVVEAVSDLNQLKSKTFNPEQLITIESTSKALPQGIVVVDTPGLASDIEEHDKALMNYIDKSDALLLTIDCNQGFTKATNQFLDTVNTFNKRVYAILSFSDTKISDDVEKIHKYTETDLPIKPYQVITTSIKSEEKNNFKELLNSIYKDKNIIIQENLIKKLNQVSEGIEKLIEFQLSNAKLETNDIDLGIKKLKNQIDKNKYIMSNQINTLQKQFSEGEDKAIREFRSSLSKDLPKLTDIAFKNKEEFEISAQKSMKKALNRAITKYEHSVKHDLGTNLETMKQEIAENIRVNIPGLNVTDVLVFVLEVAIMDLLIPIPADSGKVLNAIEKGPLDGIIGKIAVDLVGKESLQPFRETLKEITSALVGVVAKPFIENKLKETFDATERELKERLKQTSEKITGTVKEKIFIELQNSEDKAIESLEILQKEKNTAKEQFEQYMDGLKTIQQEMKNLRKGR